MGIRQKVAQHSRAPLRPPLQWLFYRAVGPRWQHGRGSWCSTGVQGILGTELTVGADMGLLVKISDACILRVTQENRTDWRKPNFYIKVGVRKTLSNLSWLFDFKAHVGRTVLHPNSYLEKAAPSQIKLRRGFLALGSDGGNSAHPPTHLHSPDTQRQAQFQRCRSTRFVRTAWALVQQTQETDAAESSVKAQPHGLGSGTADTGN
ncbi:hypothetical protein CB1_001066021 [Camelus ferus]|nr:hypothetical protein CB1_001066021 [Camelus ferus]